MTLAKFVSRFLLLSAVFVCLFHLPLLAQDSDGDLVAAGGVAEPVSIDTTLDTTGEAVDIFDFTIVDGGSADGVALTVSAISINVSGTASDATRDQLTYRLNGNDASNVVGVYNGGADTITFSGLSISVADNTSETYTINAFFNDNTTITEGQTIILGVDGDTDLTVGGGGTQMGATTGVTNGAGSPLAVTATTLAVTTQPAGSVSGVALTNQPVVSAEDAFGNVDKDFTETITLTEASAGSLSNATVAASNGVATFTNLTYTATTDQQSFTLTANDQDGVGTNLPTVDANAVTSDVVATKLLVTTEPAPTTMFSNNATAFTTVPIVAAVNADDVTDTGWSNDVTVIAFGGAGVGTLTGTGDSDGDPTAVTLTPASGVTTFTGLTINYDTAENFVLRFLSTGLTTDDSTTLTANAFPSASPSSTPSPSASPSSSASASSTPSSSPSTTPSASASATPSPSASAAASPSTSPSAQVSPSPAVSPAVAYLTGRVIDKDTQTPIPDVAISVNLGGLLGNAFDSTDENGEFSIGVAKPGNYRIYPESASAKFKKKIKIKANEYLVIEANAKEFNPRDCAVNDISSTLGDIKSKTNETFLSPLVAYEEQLSKKIVKKVDQSYQDFLQSLSKTPSSLLDCKGVLGCKERSFKSERKVIYRHLRVLRGASGRAFKALKKKGVLSNDEVKEKNATNSATEKDVRAVIKGVGNTYRCKEK